ncbi:MAG: hypothetical protein ACPGKS_08760 [Coraliomargarita sp.]
MKQPVQLYGAGSFWNGVEIDIGTGDQYFNNGDPLQPGDSGFNNASSFTLEDWGFAPDGTVAPGVFTTNEIRLGSINTDQSGAHDLTFTFREFEIIEADNTVTIFTDISEVPEPSGYGFIAGAVALGVSVGRRKL